MVKPVFTPDPPPSLEGLEEEDARRVWNAYLEAQFNRIRDLWPEDYLARLEALERQFPFIPGVWPMVDWESFNLATAAAVGNAAVPIALIGQLGNSGGSGWTVSLDGYEAFEAPLTTNAAYNIGTIVNDGAGTFAAIGQDSVNGTGVYTTTDGKTWTRAGNPWSLTNVLAGSLCWDAKNNRWLAAMHHPSNGVSEVGTYVRASTDLASWTTLLEVTTGTPYNKIATDGDGTLLVGTSFDIKFYYSYDDGDTWTLTGTSPLQNIGGTQSSGQPVFARDRWYFCSDARGALYVCAVGQPVENSGSWTLIFFTASAFDTMGAVVPGTDGGGNNIWVGLRTLDAGATPKLYRSPNGTGFVEITAPAGITGWPFADRTALAYYDGLGWIVVDGQNIYTSDDALTWTAAPDDLVFAGLDTVAVGLKPGA